MNNVSVRNEFQDQIPLEEQPKQDVKLWAEIKLPASYETVLLQMTRDDLHLIRRELEIPRLSQLSKQSLVEELVRQAAGYFQSRISLFDKARYELCQKLASNEDYVTSFDLSESQIYYFRQLGLVFSGTYEQQQVLFMPEEVKEAFKEIDNELLRIRVEKNTKLIALTQGALYYYGYLPQDQLEERMEHYTGNPVEMNHYSALLQEASTYYDQFDVQTTGLSHHKLKDLDWLEKEHQQRTNLDFYPFTKEQLIEAGQADYIEASSSFCTLRDFIIKKYPLHEKKGKEIVMDLHYQTQNGAEMTDILAYFQAEFKEHDYARLHELVDQTVSYSNQMRQWSLKGFSSNQLISEESNTLQPLPTEHRVVAHTQSRKRKIGRNDTCPCGSGIKYKRCCIE